MDLFDLEGIDIEKLSFRDRDRLKLLLDEYTRRKARDSFGAFCIRRGYMPAAHHRLLIDRLEKLERGEIRSLMVCMPPGSAKSIYSSILYPPWFLGRNPGLLVLAASNTLELAERFGRKARGIVSEADYFETFGTKLSEESGAAARWELTNGSEYFAGAVGGSIVGRRADLLVLDDVVKNREEVESTLQRDKVWDWYKSDVLTRLKPGARKAFVNTRWHEDDLPGRILENEKGWEVLILEMENTKEDDPLGRKIGERLWPEWFTEEMVSTAKEDIGVWNSLYQQNPVPLGGGEFKSEWIEYYDTRPNKGDVAVLMLVDPAGDKGVKSDYTAIWIIGVGADGNYYVLDIVRDKLDLGERTDKVFELHRKWKPRVVRYEEYGLQSDISHIKMEMDRRVYRFKIQKVAGTRISKEDRIRRLIPIFREGKMVFPREHIYIYNNKHVDLVRVFIQEELEKFPVSKHDDLLDSLSRLVEPGLLIPKQESEEEKRMIVELHESAFEPFDPEYGY